MGRKMATPELKDARAEQTTKANCSSAMSHREMESYRLRSLRVLYYLFSFGLFSADLLTDFLVSIKYLSEGYTLWGYSSLTFTILPASITQMFSLRWYQSDGPIGKAHWLLHLLFLGVLHRYLMLISVTIHSLRNKELVKDRSWACRHECDICMLHLFDSFMGAAPQLVLQLYIMMILQQAPLWTSISCTASFSSLAWAMSAYIYAMHKITRVRDETTDWQALGLQALWRFGMILSRIAALVFLAVYTRFWFPLCFGLHWLIMTVWVILQNTDFSPSVWEERVYNCIIGLIYCFDFYNLRVGRSRFRALVFYSIIVVENCASVALFAVQFKDSLEKSVLIAAISLILVGMLLGLTGMLVYYGKYHPSTGSSNSQVLGRYTNHPQVTVDVDKPVTTPRSLKLLSPAAATNALPRPLNDTQPSQSRAPPTEEPITDKHFLLPNIAQLSELAEEGMVNPSCSHEMESPENQERKDSAVDKENLAQKRRAICLGGSETLNLEGEKPREEKRSPLQRRGISTSLVLHVGSELDSADKSRIERFTALREKLSTPTISEGSTSSSKAASDRENCAKTGEFQQKDETMSCVASIHDYENVCPLGVARPPWCIRSWKGYTDIETYIHDDSVVRDRRRDTLTSTTTGTTYSSDFSDVTCVSSILRGILKQDDYLDSLTYDLMESRDLKTGPALLPYSASIDLSNPAAAVYIAKPALIDDKGPAASALDTIVEEHDESERIAEYDNQGQGTRNYGQSVSTLVNTIDQIRRYTAEHSPRHVHHTNAGSHWDDTFDPTNLMARHRFTRALFTNDSTDRSPISRLRHINSLRDSESESDSVLAGNCEIDAIRQLVKYCTIESIKKTPLIDAILSDSPVLGTRAKLHSDATSPRSKKPSSPTEEDMYVEMNALVPTDSSNFSTNTILQTVERCKTDCSDLSVSHEIETQPNSHRRRSHQGPARHPKPNFSVLGEKFESKSPLVYVVYPNSGVILDECAGELKESGDGTHDKENLAPEPAEQHETTADAFMNKSLMNAERKRSPNTINLKERRHIFLEQVLSPPKLLSWNKKKSLGAMVKNV